MTTTTIDRATLERAARLLSAERNALYTCHASPADASISEPEVLTALVEYDEVLRALGEAMEQPAQTPWIPVSELLPLVGRTVIVGRCDALPITAWWTGGKWVAGDVSGKALHPTHWMPMPPAPGEAA